MPADISIFNEIRGKLIDKITNKIKMRFSGLTELKTNLSDKIKKISITDSVMIILFSVCFIRTIYYIFIVNSFFDFVVFGVMKSVGIFWFIMYIYAFFWQGVFCHLMSLDADEIMDTPGHLTRENFILHIIVGGIVTVFIAYWLLKFILLFA